MTRELLDVAGRFHPLLLHLPIGILAALALCEVRSIATNRPTSRILFAYLSGWSCLFAIVSAITGLLLARSEDMTDTLELHRNLGIAVAVGSLILAIQAHARQEPIPARGFGPERFWLALTLGLLFPAGHLGATLTHGADFLFAPLRAKLPESTIAQGPTFATIEPLLANYCIECHGTERKKGGLQLHTKEAIEKGGRHGPVLVAGDAKASKLVDLMRTPLEYDQHMPPDDEPQPTAAEIDLIAAWVNAGAPFDGAASASASSPTPVAASTIAASPPSTDAVHALRGRLVHVEATAEGASTLIVDFASIAERVTDEDVSSLLTPLADHIADLSLARTKITDSSLALVAKMQHLERLDLRGTKITPRGFASLAKHETLDEIVLALTSLDDSVAETLESLPKLRRVHCWRSGITDYALDALRKSRPEVIFDSGNQGPAEALEVEPTVEFGKPTPAAQPTPTADALAPTNSVCPVSGAPLDPKFRIVFDGKVVGFCCDKCLAKFLADPESYRANLK